MCLEGDATGEELTKLIVFQKSLNFNGTNPSNGDDHGGHYVRALAQTSSSLTSDVGMANGLFGCFGAWFPLATFSETELFVL